jgi:hypothetical protein
MNHSHHSGVWHILKYFEKSFEINEHIIIRFQYIFRRVQGIWTIDVRTREIDPLQQRHRLEGKVVIRVVKAFFYNITEFISFSGYRFLSK